jgi:hypothetical protein
MAAWLKGAILAGFALLALAAPAWGQACTASDLLNGLEGTISGILSDACATACEDGYGCAAAAGVSLVLSATAADAGQGAVANFCSKLNSIVGTGQNDANTVVGVLQQAGLSSAEDALEDALATLAEPVAVAQCGCDVEEGLDALGSDLGDCLQDVLCSADKALFGESCGCTPGPATIADCTQQTAASCANYVGDGGSATCTTLPNSIQSEEPNCTNNPADTTYPPVACVNGPSGTLVSQGGPTNGGSGCLPLSYCFCPKPMVPTWTQNSPSIGTSPTGFFYIFSCNCPTGTHLAGAHNGISVCLCDGTNEAPKNSDKSGGMCPPPPPPTCGKGTTRIDGKCVKSCTGDQTRVNGKCVTPCSDPTQAMTSDGVCCTPTQVSSCGTCCPAGFAPDALTGSCSPRVPISLPAPGAPRPLRSLLPRG